MRYLIVGNGDYAVMISNYFKNTMNVRVDGFTVKKDIITKETINGMPVIPAEDIQKRYSPDNCRLIMGIGYRNMNQIKQKEFQRYKDKGYDFVNYIHPTAIIEKDVVIGEGNNIFEGVIIQSGVRIGNANLIYGGVCVSHGVIMGSFNSLSVKACIAGCTHVGNNCFIGANSTVRDHITVADYTLVGAGTYLSKDSEPYDVIVTQKASILKGKTSLEFI